ncbi:cobalamin biosynthesis protein [Pseudomonas sp. KU26590]|uniref:cobalamin biosynthesis protein n=1 Tax=Pseudomonas sp. KU26590 TaxID=2991051 RepID=UPI00223CFBF3|nr:cobalamin biosynthesis protein [Pseudomonas sp. KU26590]UZJ57703.1 cobalamin biosynthesis protein [Pseudomonas sp. KU26590]
MNDSRDRPLWVVGLGCQRGCSALELRQLMDDSLRELRLGLSDIAALASIEGKSAEAGMLELAQTLGLTVGFFCAGDLAAYAPQLTYRSDIAFERTGCYGVAESAALAMATRLTGSAATLVIPRRKSPHATFALATATVRAGSTS